MAKIYISSSWRNEDHQKLVTLLREKGHKVYDFQHPEGRNDQNVWESVSAKLLLSTAYHQGILRGADYERMLLEKEVRDRFGDHFKAMNDADTCILLLPCERSSHVEAGYMAGAGKRVFVYDTSVHVKPELMYLIFDGYFYEKDDLLEALKVPIPGVCRVCGCTEDNPCYHPTYGTCWWVDEDHTLCSHCAETVMVHGRKVNISKDHNTKHCVNDASNAFRKEG